MTEPAVALVTGGSRGIGLAVAERLAGEGWVVAVAARTPERVEQAADGLPGEGHLGVVLDVADPSGWESTIAKTSALGELRGLVHAAGVLGPIGPLGSWDPEEFRRTVEINLYGTLLALRHCMPLLEASGGAAVTLSGGGATGPLARFDAYASSKAAVVRLTENLAREGARVNAVAPGFIATEIHEATLAAGPDAVGAQYFERTRRDLEAGGASMDAVCELVSFLLSDDAREIRGKLISAQWDPWREDDFRRRLAEDDDLATLRRIDEQMFRRS